MPDDLGYFQFATTPSTNQSLVIGSDSRAGYDAIKDRDRRRPPKKRVQLQDAMLLGRNREKAAATTQDLQRNFVVAAWAIRKHLDYVSTMTFAAKTDNDELDDQLEAWVANWSLRNNCDVTRRHSLRRIIRMAEARRTVDGDVAALKIGGNGVDRGKLQMLEGYRIADPPDDKVKDLDNWVNGVQLSNKGSASRYAVYKRDIKGKDTFERFVPSPNICFLAYYERFDQVRGVSPLMSGLNSFQDVYEATDLSLAKMKVAQLFGLVLYRDAAESSDQYGGPIATEDANEDGVEDSGYEFDFGEGPQFMDLEPGDRAEFLEGSAATQESVDFMKFVLSIALKSLDLPDSFLNESETNFFGSRAALLQYLRSAKCKQDDLIEFLDELTKWRLGMAVADGEIVLPAGMSFSDIAWKWQPLGVPWWDPVKEANGAKVAIGSGLDNIERVTQMNGTDVKDNIDKLAKWTAYAKETHGLDLDLSPSPVVAGVPEVDEDEEGSEEDDE